MNGESSEVLREGADDITLRAGELNTLNACTNVDHIDENIGDRRWWTQIGTPYVKQVNHHYREMSKAAGAKKRCERQKAKALWATKAAKDMDDEF